MAKITDWNKFFADCEADIRAGQIGSVAMRLRSLSSGESPRALKPRLAKLSRRVGDADLGLRWLTPTVRDEITPATAEELSEYAVCLQRTGAVDEAHHLLTNLNRNAYPVANLYLAFCHFGEWDYAGSLPHLRRYLENETDSYQLLVARLNLAAALTTVGQHQESEDLLKDCAAQAEREGLRKIWISCLEIQGQIHIARLDLVSARETLERGLAVSELNTSTEGFFLRKWMALVDALETQDTAPIRRLRLEAARLGDFETLREADFFELQIKFSEAMFHRLLFGTPWSGYRARVQKQLNTSLQAESVVFGQGPIYDLRRGMLETTGEGPTPKVHALLTALQTDTYRPATLARIFAHVFPGEHFDIFSSPNRVHQLISRLRHWLADQNLPLVIEEGGGTYALKPSGPVAFRHFINHSPIDIPERKWRSLVEAMGQNEFSAADVREVLALSPSSVKRLMSWGLEQNKVTRRGRGRATTYKVAA